MDVMKQILVVDDEPMIRAGLTKLIKHYSQGVHAYAVPNGAEAVAEIRKQKPDMVFTDIRMPKMDGLELCRHIAEMNLNIRTVVISGYGDFTYAQKCLTYGVKEYLLKPVTELELYPVLDRLLYQEKVHSLSVSAYSEWLEQAETAIWSADFEGIDRLLLRWSGDDLCGALDTEQLEQTIADVLKALVKKLNARELYQFADTPPPKSAKNRDELFKHLESELIHWCGQLAQWRGGNQKSVFEEAKSYIDDHIAEEISLEAVAERVGLAPTYFSYFFKKMTNETFVQYRMRKRIEMAKRLLELPHYKIVDVGMEIGYQNYPHFSKIFKKMTGISPTEYRQMLGIK
ncbi:putative response regulatory protein [Paenibacillus konkukensis]|uniref:Response regulatory protein n=3 Tax=Paenibacillus TaxID=44249 RepID=A0ABY4RYG9_9BACL|nr:putative response regulatory protein [Paenibacillus konkukensis]